MNANDYSDEDNHKDTNEYTSLPVISKPDSWDDRHSHKWRRTRWDADCDDYDDDDDDDDDYHDQR